MTEEEEDLEERAYQKKRKALRRSVLSDSLLGNQNTVALLTKGDREEAYRQYCAWIASGKSSRSFRLKHPTLKACGKTIENYIRDFPDDFPGLHKDVAEAAALEIWEEVGYSMMTGNVPKCQPAIFQMFMRNRFGWDKESQITHSFEPEARRLLRKLEEGE
jgi:hypothetical protein